MLLPTQEEIDLSLRSTIYSEDREVYMDRKLSEGFVIYRPEDNELLLDLDTPIQRLKFGEIYGRLCFEYPGISYKWWVSESGNGTHVVVVLPFPVSMELRLALQAILGSDPVKELLSVFRLREGDPIPTLLAVPPKTVVRKPPIAVDLTNLVQ